MKGTFPHFSRPRSGLVCCGLPENEGLDLNKPRRQAQVLPKTALICDANSRAHSHNCQGQSQSGSGKKGGGCSTLGRPHGLCWEEQGLLSLERKEQETYSATQLENRTKDKLDQTSQ